MSDFHPVWELERRSQCPFSVPTLSSWGVHVWQELNVRGVHSFSISSPASLPHNVNTDTQRDVIVPIFAATQGAKGQLRHRLCINVASEGKEERGDTVLLVSAVLVTSVVVLSCGYGTENCFVQELKMMWVILARWIILSWYSLWLNGFFSPSWIRNICDHLRP